MWRSRYGVAAVALAAVATLLAPWAQADPPVLYVTWHSDRSLSAMLADGTSVGSTSGGGVAIPAGTYKLQIDNSSNVNIAFDLSGPGVKLVDSLSNGEELAAAYTETFQPSSTYTYRDDNHPSVVWTFTTSTASVGVGTAPVATTPTKTTGGGQTSTDIVGSAVVPFRGSLTGSVGVAGVALKVRGSLRTGRYRIVVSDTSSTRGFTLQRLHDRADVLTGARFVGRRTVTLDLGPGRWFYFATPAKKLQFLVVS